MPGHTPLRVLAIDIEGGHGGSSRSLAQMLHAIDLDAVSVEVWCRRGGAIEASYQAHGIPVRVTPDMPRLTVLERNSRNLIDIAGFFGRRWPRSAAFRASLLEKLATVDLLHLNHVSLFWLARWIRRRLPSFPITMHIRTQPVDGPTARWQARVARAVCSRFVFISENERDHLARQSGGSPNGEVIYNPVAVDRIAAADNAGLVAVCLSNFSYGRGIDRLASVAAELDKRGDRSVRFVVAGDMQLTRTLPGALGVVAREGGDLADFMAREGVAPRFEFLGHVDDPEALLQRSDILLKPTREDNPWGRDILEALGHGVPVASVGSYDRFVETGSTGLLQRRFDAAALADWLIELAEDKPRLEAMRTTSADRIAALCDPQRQAAALARFWRDTVAAG